MGVVDKRIPEADPYLRIAGVQPGSVLQDADGVFALSVAGERFGNSQPAFCMREVPKKCVARIGQREHITLVDRLSRRRRQARPTLQGIT